MKEKEMKEKKFKRFINYKIIKALKTRAYFIAIYLQKMATELRLNYGLLIDFSFFFNEKRKKLKTTKIPLTK